MEKPPEFTIQDVQDIIKTSERLNKHKDEIKRFLRIIEGFLAESCELDIFLMNHKISSGCEITKINFNREPLENYSCSLWVFNIYPNKWRITFTMYFAGVRQTTIDISSYNTDGLSRHLVPIFYFALPEILEALTNLFPKLKKNMQELIQISNTIQ